MGAAVKNYLAGQPDSTLDRTAGREEVFMSTETWTDLSRFTEKMVNLRVWTDDEDLVSKGTIAQADSDTDRTLIDISGRITVVNPNGEVFLFKPRSQRTTHMLETVDVQTVELAGSATLRPVGQKSLRRLSAQTARRHLADFHAWPLSQLNGMSDELALQRHEELDHEDLGHNHSLADDGSNSKASPATAAARASILAEIDAA